MRTLSQGIQRDGARHSYRNVQTYQQLLQEAESDEEDVNSRSTGNYVNVWVPISIILICMALATLCRVCSQQFYIGHPVESEQNTTQVFAPL